MTTKDNAKKMSSKAEASADTKSTDTLITVTQVRSVIRCTQSQRATIIGLGLRGIGSKSQLVLTNSVAGMIRKVEHLIMVS